MKRFLFVYFFFLLNFVVLSAQNEDSPGEIDWGKELREPPGSSISNIIAVTEGGFFALRRREAGNLNKFKVFLERYDNKMNLKRSTDLNLKYKNKTQDFEHIVMLDQQLYLLTSFNNQAKQKNYLFRQKVSHRSLQADGKLVKIGEIDTQNKVKEGRFGFKLSRDSSKLLIYNQLPYKKNEPERLAFRVFDKNFEPTWDKNIVLPYPDNNFSVEEYRVDKAGNVYLLGVIFQDRVKVRRGGRPNYQYVILVYSQDKEEAQQYSIDLGDKFITDLTFRMDRNKNLVCSGFYSEKGDFSVKGTYFLTINTATKEIIQQNLKEFDFEFVTQHFTDREKQRAKRAELENNNRRAAELYRYSLDDLILRSDGGALLIAEQYYVYERRYDQFNNYSDRFFSPYFYPYSFSRFNRYGGANRVDYYFNYNDIIVVNIRPDGSIEWATRIPKRQRTVNDGGYYSSYAMATIRDRLYFIYNDNARNFDEDRRNNRIFNFDGRQSIITVAEVKIDGSLDVFPLYSNRDANIITRPKICKQVGRKKMAIYGERGATYRFGHLNFD